MIKVSEAARAQVEIAARDSGAEGLPLRIAAVRTPEGGIDYRMGFDDDGIREDDAQVTVGNIIVVVSAEDQPVLEGTTLDYVEIEKDKFHFIFDNPNDPSHTKPKKKKK